MNDVTEYMIVNVDDHEASRYARSRILRSAGYRVLEAATGADTLRLVGEVHPQLVLLDVNLPDMSGLEVCKMLKADSSTGHVIIVQISATHVTGADRILGLEGGADIYLTEPVEPGELLATVKAMLRLFAREAENRQLLERLREADRQKDEFLATLAHELRNPLHPIRGAVEVMRLKDNLDIEIQASRDIIDLQVTHLARLVDDLLDVARITRNKLELRMERLALAEILKDAIDSTRALLESHGHRLTVTLPPPDVLVEADHVRLTQVFVNLLTNAAKYTPPGGRIRFSTRLQRGEITVSVEDTGIGIAPEKLPYLFNMFYQADSSLDRTAGGLGVGLTLARQLIELHRGTIEAKSAGPGAGSEFLVRLPVAAETPAAPAQTRESQDGPTGRWRILIVDDSRLTTEIFARALRRRGHETEVAHNGADAIRLAEGFRPDAVLLDVGMPGLNGFETCEHIRRQPWGRNIAAIAVTGWGQEDIQARARQAGFDALLVKPVSGQEILQTVARLLESRRSA